MDLNIQVRATGHAPQCLFGPRSWFHLTADGTWQHNP